MSDRVSITVDSGIAEVRLNRPDKRNALDGPMFSAIAEAGARLKHEPGLRAVVLSGEGESFCAGLDFGMFEGLAGGGGGQQVDDAGHPGRPVEGGLTHLGQQVCWVWQEVPVPVIAAVHGHALGGGLQIALGADIRLVHPAAQLSVREVHWGLVPDMTGTLMLTQLVRPDVAKELTFTGRIVSGVEALELGLATRLSESPRDDALALAGAIAGRSPDAVRGAKRLFNGLLHADAAKQLAAEREVIGGLIGRPNQVEAVLANLGQRAPVFVDPAGTEPV
jgi:enoyl-CoA hydratase/carnithine racemase